MSHSAHVATSDYLSCLDLQDVAGARDPSIGDGIWRAIATGMALALIGLSLSLVAVEAGNAPAAQDQAAAQTVPAIRQMPVP